MLKAMQHAVDVVAAQLEAVEGVEIAVRSFVCEQRQLHNAYLYSR